MPRQGKPAAAAYPPSLSPASLRRYPLERVGNQLEGRERRTRPTGLRQPWGSESRAQSRSTAASLSMFTPRDRRLEPGSDTPQIFEGRWYQATSTPAPHALASACHIPKPLPISTLQTVVAFTGWCNTERGSIPLDAQGFRRPSLFSPAEELIPPSPVPCLRAKRSARAAERRRLASASAVARDGQDSGVPSPSLLLIEMPVSLETLRRASVSASARAAERRRRGGAPSRF